MTMDDKVMSRRHFVGAAGAVAAAGAASSVSAASSGERRGRFAGKVAWITGGARGQGRSHAQRLAAEGADIILSDSLKDVGSIDYPMARQSDMDDTADMVRAAGGRVLAIRSDIRDAASAADVVRQGQAMFGRIDLMVANAGIYGTSSIAAMSDALFDDIIQTNLYGVFHAIRAVLPGMVDQRFGRIVVTSSLAGRSGHATGSAYCASKWGIIGMVKAASLEVARQNITMNCVCPTSVNTPLIDNPAGWAKALPGDPEPTRAKFQAKRMANPHSPQGIAWVEPSDVSDTVLFLLSEEARHITGSAIDVAAGAMANNAA
ncbi:SDR family mycofactocin-dependent oxidoreductase [Sphingobium sp. OAS761]|uniref:mycofactocin-coupled SDR family oxidoreductase n=1 Tax=Sphingobium sp. OAS761 TaxID=2817901 RepID=UPI00209F6ADF|nr:mycofactocin-coupled SDR family oxidoreductase [Sphingobium sp. OAS761]MCP1471715.1 SDR family mycofactocin-dependent oxidoreductase [Sphingobium sp. OAS761]